MISRGSCPVTSEDLRYAEPSWLALLDGCAAQAQENKLQTPPMQRLTRVPLCAGFRGITDTIDPLVYTGGLIVVFVGAALALTAAQ